MVSEFSELKKQFLRIWAHHNPTSAASEGWREFAGFIPDPSLLKLQNYLHTLKSFEKALSDLNFDSLDKIEQLDFEIIQNKIDSEKFGIEIMENYKSNPLTYVGPAFIFDYLLKDYAPLGQRLNELILHLNQLPEYYKTAVNNLDNQKIAPENAKMAMFMLQGMVSFLENIPNEVKNLSARISISSKIESDLIIAGKTAANAISQLVTFIQKNMENFEGSYRLGYEKYSKMLFSNERVEIKLAEILKAGKKNLERNLVEFNNASKEIDEDGDPRDIISEIKKNHPTSESLVNDTKHMLREIQTFLKNEEFVSVPSEVMPEVIYTPKPFREWAFAAMNTPGALERKATNSYYYITPPSKEWSKQDQEDWLQTFNYLGLLDICVHEAFPGHYLHHLHNQRSKSLMSKLFGAYHFWEGYALYVEEAMWEHGFQKGDPKYRMAQLVETILRNVRLICSIKLHTDPNFTVEDATKMFMEKVFMGRKPAELEAKRGTYDPGYLNYALGKLMIEKLRDDYKLEKGDSYKIKEFHDELLSFGAPPVPILRKYMLKNKEIHTQIL